MLDFHQFGFYIGSIESEILLKNSEEIGRVCDLFYLKLSESSNAKGS